VRNLVSRLKSKPNYGVSKNVYLFVISARASAIPSFPLVPARIALVLPLDDLPLMLDPSTFPLRVLYRLPNCVDLFSLVVAFGRKHLPAPGGGGGGAAAAPLPRGIDGGGAGAGPDLKGIGGGGGGTSAKLELKGSGGGGGSALFGCSTGGDDVGGGGGIVHVVGRGEGGGGGGGGGVSGDDGDATDPCAFCCRVGVCNGLGDTESFSTSSIA